MIVTTSVKSIDIPNCIIEAIKIDSTYISFSYYITSEDFANKKPDATIEIPIPLLKECLRIFTDKS